MLKTVLASSLLLPLLIFPSSVSAHSFGVLYNLPVPFWMYLYGAASALVVSFLMIGYFVTKKSENTNNYPTQKLPAMLISDNFLKILKLISVLLFILTIVSGLVGKNSSALNFNMTFFWIIFTLGLTYLTALVGNVYALLNPWKVIAEWLEIILGNQFKGIIKYKLSLGYYPALVFYLFFIWIELFGQIRPANLSLILLIYTIFNLAGTHLIGKTNWFKYCEFFSVFFHLIGKLSPIEYSPRFQLRPQFTGLLKDNADHLSLVLFIVFMLASTAYDGFSETIIWHDFYIKNFFGTVNIEVFYTIGLILSLVLFFSMYLILIYSAKIITNSNLPVKELSLRFAFSLVPIAFVYNMAHYYTLILTEGQNFIRLLSDPFAFGWNLFNTANYRTDLSVINAGFTWHTQVGLIVFGHIVSVYIAHKIALQIFSNHKNVLLSQIPILLLMVAYTVIGLWILSQPVTGGTL